MTGATDWLQTVQNNYDRTIQQLTENFTGM